MRRPTRQIEELELDPYDTGAVLDWMQRLRKAGDGWVNLLPGVPGDEVEEPPRSIFSALFGTAQPPVIMATWSPPRGRTGDHANVGIMHPRGRFAVRQLGSAGVHVPPGWRVRQDHGRHGLVVEPPAGTPDHLVLDWTFRAAAALTMVPLTGRWQARVYLPR